MEKRICNGFLDCKIIGYFDFENFRKRHKTEKPKVQHYFLHP